MKVSTKHKLNRNSNDILDAEYFHWTELDGRYVFIQYLGHSLTSHNAEGKHIKSGKKVTLKKVLRIREPIDAKKLLRQIKILQALRGLDNILELVDILPPTNFANFTKIILAFEYVDTDLSQLIRSDQYFTISHIQYILYQILLGLKYMHSLNIFHQNLKPENILVNQNCTVKIFDGFDLVCSRFDKANIVNNFNVCYVAPEIMLLQQQSEHFGASNIWSVGCIFAELLGMLRDNVPSYKHRKPLFTPSYYDMIANNININPLKNIFDIIGTPTPDEILNIDDNRVEKLLMQIPKCSPVDFNCMYPGNDDIALSLLRGCLQFDHVGKRITLDEALYHPFIQNVRDNKNEMKCMEIINKIKQSDLLDLKFENMNMTINMYRSVIIKEVAEYSRNFSGLVVPGYINKYYFSSLVPPDIIMLINRYYIIDEI